MSSKNIYFASIPSSIRKPGAYTEYNVDRAISSLPAAPNKILVIGQKTSSGIGVVNTPYKIFTSADAVLYAGAGSIAHLTCAAALKANPNIDLSLIVQADGAGTAAEGTITFSVTATIAGSIDVWIANNYINFSVAIGDDPTAVAAAFMVEFNKIATDLPVTAVAALGVVTFTAKNLGTQGNQIAIATRANDCDVTIVTVQPTGGATDPVLTDALTAAFPGNYNIYVTSLNEATGSYANLKLLKTHMASLATPAEDRPAIAVYGYVGVQATVETLCGTTLNYERFSTPFLPYTKTTEGGHSLDYEIAGAYAGVIASEEDPAMPLNGLELKGIAPSAVANRLSRAQQESCLKNGVTPLEIISGEVVRIVRAVTNYITNAAGTVDPTYLDITTIKTLDYVRLAIETRERLRFGRAKLSSKTPAKVRAQIIDVLLTLESLEIVDNVDANLDGIIVEKDSVDMNRLNCLIPADVVNGLHILANRIDLIL